ncbi:TonB-dependent receptor [Tsuneonella suprasediminis]|uniref:TonB-dependent receptor n=1 Tax=Tsuneonella suprasediminis TaxID=2306996 RepID=A0A419R5K9_9SPHN|nr:TonB-dependent receptor [Tsuneonella suprasediminis]RJX71203.1 TonB-dependent receptor [Tsuneonella suprasediminis]
MNSFRLRLADRTRFALLAGVAITVSPAVAVAQDGTEDVATPAQAREQAGEAEAGVGNAIIVTATKRAQTLQDVPVAVSVTTAETIERAQIRDVSDLSSVVPSLKVTQSQNAFATTYSIRGFGTSGNNIGLEPSVAVFVDGVYRSRSMSQISDLPDIERVEVLRGPQSTLFGKNASAGVISIVTKSPSFTPHGSIEASYGNFNDIVAKGYLTGPISDTIAASISGGYHSRDGYVTNLYNGDDIGNRNRWFARGQVLFEPSSDFKFRVIGDYDEIDEKCCAVFNLRPSAATAAVMAVGGMVNDYQGVPGADEVYTDVVPSNKVRNWGVSGQADYTMGALTLTSITAYRETKLEADQDVDFTSAPLASGANVGQANLNTFTQELRIASDFDGPLNFLLGGYYFNEVAETHDQIVYGDAFRDYANLLIQSASGGAYSIPTLETTFSALTGNDYTGQFFASGQGLFNNMRQKDEAWSIFGNVDFEMAAGLTLTLGANYTRDTKKVTSNTTSTDVFSGLDLTSIGQTAIYQQALATQVGTLLGLGQPANATQIAAFAGNNPAGYQQVQAGVQAYAAANADNPAVNPLLSLTSLQFLPPFQNFPNAVEDGRFSDGDWSWTARLAYEFSPTLNAYASWSTGYKAASYNLSRDSRPSPTDYAALVQQGLAVTNLRAGSRYAQPEDSEVYEIGLKGNWGLAAANLTVFKQSISNFQTNTFTGTGYVFANAGKQSTWGVEFDGYVRPTDQLTLTLAMTYLDPKYDDFTNSPFGDLSGETVTGIPKLSAVWGATWDQPVGDDHLILHADFAYSAPYQIEPGLLAFAVRNPDGTLDYEPARAAARPYRNETTNLNASITYAMANGFELSVWGRNLLDDRNITGVFDSVAQAGSISGYTDQPRTYGVSARFKF